MIQRSKAPKGKKNQTATSDTPVTNIAIQNPITRFRRIQYPDEIRRLAKNKKIITNSPGIVAINVPISVVIGTSEL